MKGLAEIAKKHGEWVDRVKKMGCNPSDAEDIVQEAYIKISRMFKGDETRINKTYFHSTLYSVFIDYTRAKRRSKVSLVNKSIPNLIDETFSEDEEDYDIKFDLQLYEMWDEIEKEMDTWDETSSYPYNKEICLSYLSTDMSLRKLSKDSGIPKNSIVNTVTKGRERLRAKFGDKIKQILKEHE